MTLHWPTPQIWVQVRFVTLGKLVRNKMSYFYICWFLGLAVLHSTHTDRKGWLWKRANIVDKWSALPLRIREVLILILGMKAGVFVTCYCSFFSPWLHCNVTITFWFTRLWFSRFRFNTIKEDLPLFNLRHRSFHFNTTVRSVTGKLGDDFVPFKTIKLRVEW